MKQVWQTLKNRQKFVSHCTAYVLPTQHSSPNLPLLSIEKLCTYRKVVSFSTSCLEAHAGIFRLLMKGTLDPYVL